MTLPLYSLLWNCAHAFRDKLSRLSIDVCWRFYVEHQRQRLRTLFFCCFKKTFFYALWYTWYVVHALYTSSRCNALLNFDERDKSVLPLWQMYKCAVMGTISDRLPYVRGRGAPAWEGVWSLAGVYFVRFGSCDWTMFFERSKLCCWDRNCFFWGFRAEGVISPDRWSFLRRSAVPSPYGFYSVIVDCRDDIQL